MSDGRKKHNNNRRSVYYGRLGIIPGVDKTPSFKNEYKKLNEYKKSASKEMSISSESSDQKAKSYTKKLELEIDKALKNILETVVNATKEPKKDLSQGRTADERSIEVHKLHGSKKEREEFVAALAEYDPTQYEMRVFVCPPRDDSRKPVVIKPLSDEHALLSIIFMTILKDMANPKNRDKVPSMNALQNKMQNILVDYINVMQKAEKPEAKSKGPKLG